MPTFGAYTQSDRPPCRYCGKMHSGYRSFKLLEAKTLEDAQKEVGEALTGLKVEIFELKLTRKVAQPPAQVIWEKANG
jgi:hypothetical protein